MCLVALLTWISRTEHEWDKYFKAKAVVQKTVLLSKNKRSGVGQACALVPAVSVTCCLTLRKIAEPL